MTPDDKAKIVLEFISLHAHNKLEQWAPENHSPSHTISTIYDDLMAGLYGDLISVDGGFQIEIAGEEREDGKPYLYRFKTDV